MLFKMVIHRNAIRRGELASQNRFVPHLGDIQAKQFHVSLALAAAAALF